MGTGPPGGLNRELRLGGRAVGPTPASQCHWTGSGVGLTLDRLTDSRISVIIPVYNSPEQLGECLRALSLSSVAPLECIVVDDGSTDDTAEVARASDVTVISAPTHSGPACARNLGARSAQGEILLFLDADVCVHDDTLERVAAALARDPELDAVIGSYDD